MRLALITLILICLSGCASTYMGERQSTPSPNAVVRTSNASDVKVPPTHVVHNGMIVPKAWVVNGQVVPK